MLGKKWGYDGAGRKCALGNYLRCIISTSVREGEAPATTLVRCAPRDGTKRRRRAKASIWAWRLAAAYGASHRNRSPVHGKRMQCRKYCLCCPRSRRSHPPSDSCLSKTGLLAFLWSRLPRPSHYTIICAVLLLAHQEEKKEKKKRRKEKKKKMMMMIMMIACSCRRIYYYSRIKYNNNNTIMFYYWICWIM